MPGLVLHVAAMLACTGVDAARARGVLRQVRIIRVRKTLQELMPRISNNGKLSLDAWQLRGVMSSAFSRLRDLQSVDVGKNRITALPADLGNLTGLESFVLQQNEHLGLAFRFLRVAVVKSLLDTASSRMWGVSKLRQLVEFL